ncbi:hypothetical protein OG407_07835 [Streptomyces sp. NBC_01515]|uniref:hypothetical protein n=1 Tax=Streptomyces sp. NBC_01515 TaxID=2903890 RepID=UPI003863E106
MSRSTDDAATGWPRSWPLTLLGAAVVPGPLLFVVGRWPDAPAVQAWRTVRLAITTPCAADAQSIKVRVYGIPALSANTWGTITATWHASRTLGTSSAVAALDGVTAQKVAKPVNAYQDALPLPTSR